MTTPIAVDFLVGLFESHGMHCSIDEDWVLPELSPHAIRADWHPLEKVGRLDVQVLVGDDFLIQESFAGNSNDEHGLRDALTSFTVNVFHVLLAVLWDQNDPEQISTESWSVGGNSYTAYIGNFSTRASKDVVAHIPESLFPRIAQEIQREPLQAKLHWFRFFFCNLAGEYTFEALRDNQDWSRGNEFLKEIQWQPSAGYYSVRLFIMLQVAPEPTARLSLFKRLKRLI